jgi:hypothetical protein
MPPVTRSATKQKAMIEKKAAQVTFAVKLNDDFIYPRTRTKEENKALIDRLISRAPSSKKQNAK